MSRVLVISDLHEPCSRPGALKFCKDLRNKYKTNKTVFIGDVTDWHSISFHAKHPEMPGIKLSQKLLSVLVITIGGLKDWPKQLIYQRNLFVVIVIYGKLKDGIGLMM